MLFGCAWRNVETSCHEHFVVSRHQQTPPLTTSDKCHDFPRSGGAVLITPSQSQWWQHAMKPGIRLRIAISVYTPPAFDAPLWGDRRNIAMPFGVEKKLQNGLATRLWKCWRYIYSFWQNSRTWRTDTAWLGRACIASCGKNGDFYQHLALTISCSVECSQHAVSTMR